MDVVEECRRVM